MVEYLCAWGTCENTSRSTYQVGRVILQVGCCNQHNAEFVQFVMAEPEPFDLLDRLFQDFFFEGNDTKELISTPGESSQLTIFAKDVANASEQAFEAVFEIVDKKGTELYHTWVEKGGIMDFSEHTDEIKSIADSVRKTREILADMYAEGGGRVEKYTIHASEEVRERLGLA